jgi:toxin ParE1/3/4
MRVRHTVRARRDLINIWLEIAPTNLAAAERLYNRLEARVEILRRFPEAARLRPDIAPGARVLVESPYVILYRIVPQGVQVVRVLHGSRNIDRAVFTEGIE